MAGGQHEEEAGKKQGEAGVAEVESGVGDLIDLPRDGDGLRFGAEDHEHAGRLVEAEVSREECASRLLFPALRGGRHISVCFHTVQLRGLGRSFWERFCERGAGRLVSPDAGALDVRRFEGFGKLQAVAKGAVEADVCAPDKGQRQAGGPSGERAGESQQQREGKGVAGVVEGGGESQGAGRVAEQGEVRNEEKQREEQPAMREEVLVCGATEREQEQTF